MRRFIVAMMFGLFLVAPSSGQETPPDTSAIEAAHAAWTTKANRKNRKALDAALEAYEGPPTTETVKAHLERGCRRTSIRQNFRILREVLRDSAKAAAKASGTHRMMSSRNDITTRR